MATAAPTGRDARIDSLDVLRGVAILGILLLNILDFGLPEAYDNPTIFGGATGADFWAWATVATLFEGTMRGLFTLLFGAGVVLFTSRLERAQVPDVADLHVRRMLCLILFGFVNSHLLLWLGDILWEYGVVGLMLYAFRKTRARTLLVLSTAILIAVSLRGVVDVLELQSQRTAADAAQVARAAGSTLSKAQQDALDTWSDHLKELKPSGDQLQEEIAAMRGGFPAVFKAVTDYAFVLRTSHFYRYGFAEDIATMLLGMALFAMGVLQGRWSARRYALLAVTGYALGLLVNGLETNAVVRSGFDVITLQWTLIATYQLGRVPMTLGHLGLVLLIWKSGLLPAAMRRLAAVGRMALTNYLAQSVICALLFTGVGFGFYAQLPRHQLYYVVAGIWVVQLLWSPWWLARCQYGPAEWAWRSLTYGRIQEWRRAVAPR
ncbi:MAG: DUF418 domain-containing protein [Steroidobacteraceae bacterium]